MSSKNNNIPEHIYDYIIDNSFRDNSILQSLRKETAQMPHGTMQISPDQGQFMALMAKAVNAKKAIEVGTFTGYSALVVAQSLPPDGLLVACDISEEFTAKGAKFWKDAGVSEKIDLRIGPAITTLDKMISNGESGEYDMAFIDADKENYAGYYERCLTLLRTGGLIMVDNVLWGGRTADPEINDESTTAIRDLTRFMKNDQRIAFSLIPLGDGLSLAVKL